MPSTSLTPSPVCLLVGASRGLGHALAAELLRRGWHVIGTVRGNARTPLHDLADAHRGHVEVEPLDVTDPDEVAALRGRLAGRSLDMLFVNAGIAGPEGPLTAAISTAAFADVMVTNALSPMHVIDALQDLVPATGLIGIMSSGQGSVANNRKGGHDVYRASKAALNQLMRSYAARQEGQPRALVLLAPGWIRTALGGPDAPVGMEEAVPKVADVLLAQQGRPGLRYLDRDGNDVPW